MTVEIVTMRCLNDECPGREEVEGEEELVPVAWDAKEVYDPHTGAIEYHPEDCPECGEFGTPDLC